MEHPADALLVGLLVVGLGGSAELQRRGFVSPSSRAHLNWKRKLIVAGMAAHLLGLIPPRWDPLCRVGACIPRRTL